MVIQGTQLDILRAIANIQEEAAVEEVEDLEIAEEAKLEVKTVQNSLNALAKDGYLRLGKVERLSGSGYLASLTSQGWTALEESGH